MFTKVSVLPIVKSHIGTLYDASTANERPRKRDFVLFFGLPLIIGSGAFFVDDFDYGTPLTALSILAGLSFAAVIFAFELRITMSEKYEPGENALVLCEELFYNLLYSVLVAMALIIIGLVAPTGTGWLSPAFRYVFFALSANYVLTLLMCIRRLHSAFYDAIR